MHFTYKYRLYPTKAQMCFLERQLLEACSLYNAAKQERDDAWKTCRKSISYCDQANQLKAMRDEGLIGLANFSCCQDVLRRLDKTYKAFFRRCKRGDKPGEQHYLPFIRRRLQFVGDRETAHPRSGTRKGEAAQTTRERD